MFDQLIVTETETNHVKSRKGYFTVSALVVGVVAFVGVVISIFAADFSLGTRDFEITSLVVPVDVSVVPEPPKPRRQLQQQNSQPSQAKVATRTDHIQNLNEVPRDVPPISTTPSTAKARPEVGAYTISNVDLDPGTPGVATGRESGGPGSGTEPSGGLSEGTVAETKTADPPLPPPVKVDPPKPPAVKSGGVVNGLATHLPKPNYPAPAKAVKAHGSVSVQVLIDESGRVISASAVNGHPLLRGAAVDAARSAKFTPTKLSGTPVKVSGVIVYNFNLS
jgi:periplasmic protein TonB